MAGPIIAALGPFAFTAYGFGLKTISRSLKTPWAAIKVPGGLDRLQWMGGDSETMRIEGVLFPAEFGGRTSLNGISAAAKAGTPLHLIQLSAANTGSIVALCVIEGVDDEQSYIGPDGVPRKNAYSLDLKRYSGGSFSFAEALASLF